MATHALNFLDGLGVATCDVLGFSFGGMVAQQMARDRPSIVRRMIRVGTAPRGGEEIMHLEKPTLARHFRDPTLKGYAMLQKIFFAPTSSSQAAGGGFIERLAQRKEDFDPASGPDVAAAIRSSGSNCGEQPNGRASGHNGQPAMRGRCWPCLQSRRMVGVGARQPAQATWGEPMAFRARMRDIASARRMMVTRTDQNCGVSWF